MSEIIFQEANCAECAKILPKYSVAVVVTPEFIVCCECNEEVESQWAYFLERKDAILNGDEV